jgi:DNA (cytosine-5)-methyltransferase 1
MLTFLDFCAGIGGFRLGLELAGHTCIGYCEKDKFAVRSYKAMFVTKGEWFANDITTLKPEDVPNADLWCFGFPCQDVSIAGKQQGLNGDRSGIYYSILNLVKGKKEEAKPTYLLVENVKNLLSVNDGWDFAEVLAEMDEAGYDAIWQVLNSKDFGVPQNRERVFIIAYLRSRGRREILPVSRESSGHLKQIAGGSQGCRVYDPVGVSVALASQSGGAGAKTGLYFVNQPAFRQYETSDCCQTLKARDYKEPVMVVQKTHGTTMTVKQDETGTLQAARLDKIPCVMPVLTPDRAEKRQNGRRCKTSGEPMFTLTGQDRHGVAVKELEHFRIRRLTPKECWRLQGFPDELFEKARVVNSDSQLYKQAGNAVTVTVVYALAIALPEI